VPRVPSVEGLGFPATIYPLENRVSSDSAAPTPFIFQTIDSIGEKELDSLPYGVIQLDAQGTVLRYNAYEEGLSGLTRQKVVGKNFFKQIAPCTDMQEFYGRFREGVAAGELHCTFRYHFAFKRNPRDVTVTLLYNAREKLTWVLVQPIDSQT
jgi:photoactive yellow protein